QAALAHPTLIAVAAVIYLAALSTVFGYGAWNFLLTKYSAGTVAPFSLLVPIFGILSGVLVLGESFDKFEIAGALLVIAGLIFSNFGGALLNPASTKKMAEL
ncbi:MAG: EamA family transporter, partial [Pseudomonadota bacterium]|nr:EamA family transporter [Pseudomonadota bacterium]